MGTDLPETCIVSSVINKNYKKLRSFILFKSQQFLKYAFEDNLLNFKIFQVRLRQMNALELFRRYEKAYSALERKNLDIDFLIKCRDLGVLPKFIYNVPVHESLHSEEKMKYLKKILLRTLGAERRARKILISKLVNVR